MKCGASEKRQEVCLQEQTNSVRGQKGETAGADHTHRVSQGRAPGFYPMHELKWKEAC